MDDIENIVVKNSNGFPTGVKCASVGKPFAFWPLFAVMGRKD